MDILPLILLGHLIFGVVMGGFCAYLAEEKGHSGGAWFVLGLLFSFLALLVLIGLPNERGSSREHSGAPLEVSTYARPP